MAKDIDCSACEELRENAPNFVQNGITDTECNSLKNDTGFNPRLTTLHTDCEDLDTANDCLIGMMDGEIEKYEPCDWQKFMHKFIPNLYQFLKAEVCALCGIWTNIHNLWANVRDLWNHMRQAEQDIDNLEDRMDVAERDIDRLERETDRIDCIVDYMSQGASFYIGENTSGNAYAVAGKGVSFLTAHASDEFTADISLQYIAGGLLRGNGAFKFYNDDFTDDKTVGNFDNGSTYRESRSRRGNPIWGQYGRPATGGELICEFRIKNSAYPQIKSMWSGFGMETGGGAYHVQALVFDEGDWAYGQHGWCNSAGYAAEDGFDAGHQVPSGWTYVQLRLTFSLDMNANGTQYSPRYFIGVRMNENGIDC